MNTKKISFGIVLIICSVGLAFAAFYVMEIKPEVAQMNLEEAQPEKTEAKTKPQQKIVIDYEDEKSKVSEVTEVKESGQKPVPEQVKSTKVSKKSSGFLWIDRKSNKYVVTLGKKNGLVAGSRLTVYYEEKKLGKVEVETLYDTIAYVRLIDISTSLSENDYYRVVFE